jgi:hypothetical protein
MSSKNIKNLFAVGRLKTGQMNKTEARYSRYLNVLLDVGDIAWFKFEGIKFRLANNCFYTPDFVIMRHNGELQCHEVKGHKAIFMDDAKVKIKTAAEMYPVRFFVVYPPDKAGSDFRLEEVT